MANSETVIFVPHHPTHQGGVGWGGVEGYPCSWLIKSLGKWELMFNWQHGRCSCLLPPGSPGLILSSGYSLCRVWHVLHMSVWVSSDLHGLASHPEYIPFSHHSFPASIGFEKTMTLTMIKQLLKKIYFSIFQYICMSLRLYIVSFAQW